MSVSPINLDQAQTLKDLPGSLILFGLLSCPPCHTFKAALISLEPELEPKWGLYWCQVTPREARELIGSGEIRSIPAVVATSPQGRSGVLHDSAYGPQQATQMLRLFASSL